MIPPRRPRCSLCRAAAATLLVAALAALPGALGGVALMQVVLR